MKEIKMEFPTIENWRKILAPGDEKFGNKEFYDYYKIKYEIAARFNPQSICEIGIRYGYSAYAFLAACPAASFTGYDLVGGGHGGVKVDTFEHVCKILSDIVPSWRIKLVHADTRKLESLGGPYDFIHVDGNHTEQGAYHDMEIAFKSLSPGGVILIDDVTYIAGVYRAAVRFAENYKKKIELTETVMSLRGEFIIKKK